MIRRRRPLHDAFHAGIIVKGIDGTFEVIGGLLLLLVQPRTIGRFVLLLTEHELSRDPEDIIARYLLTAVQHLSESSQLFGSLYLLSHGFIKLFLIAALWNRKLWAYPSAIAFFVLFILYQLYRYALSHSVWLILLSIFDAFVVFLTWVEYRSVRREM